MAGDALSPTNMHLDGTQLEVSSGLTVHSCCFFHNRASRTCHSRVLVPMEALVLHLHAGDLNVYDMCVCDLLSQFSPSTSWICVCIQELAVTCEGQNTLLTYTVLSWDKCNWPITATLLTADRQPSSHKNVFGQRSPFFLRQIFFLLPALSKKESFKTLKYSVHSSADKQLYRWKFYCCSFFTFFGRWRKS